MAMIDLPLNELKQYQGINPRPADLDNYWNSALQELQAVEPNVELVPGDFTTNFADCFDLYFTGVRGARIHAKYLRPKKLHEKKCPALLHFHGYGGNSGDWYDKLPFVATGFVVAALDCRGQGGLSQDVGGVTGCTDTGHIIRGLDDKAENLLYHHIFLDTVQLASIVMAQDHVDPDRLGAMGGSQGGGLALACAALEPRVKRTAATFPFLCDYKRAWHLDMDNSAYIELRNFFRQFDPLHEREEEIFTRLGYIDIQHLVHRIKGQVLMAATLRDMVCPPSTQFAAFNKISCAKQLLLYEDHGHEYIPYLSDRIFEFITQI